MKQNLVLNRASASVAKTSVYDLTLKSFSLIGLRMKPNQCVQLPLESLGNFCNAVENGNLVHFIAFGFFPDSGLCERVIKLLLFNSLVFSKHKHELFSERNRYFRQS